MLLKAFELSELESKISKETFIIRKSLGEIKDAIEYNLEHPNYLNDKKDLYIKDTIEALDALSRLSEYLKTGTLS